MFKTNRNTGNVFNDNRKRFDEHHGSVQPDSGIKLKKEISEEGRALQKDLLEALKNTPKDKRKLRVITYKNGYQITENLISLDGTSAFEHARRNLAKLIKHQKTDQTIGWDNGHVKVLVEKYWEVPKGYFEKYPEKKEKFYIFGHTDEKQLVTTFHIQDRNTGKSIKNSSIYGKIVKDDWND